MNCRISDVRGSHTFLHLSISTVARSQWQMSLLYYNICSSQLRCLPCTCTVEPSAKSESYLKGVFLITNPNYILPHGITFSTHSSKFRPMWLAEGLEENKSKSLHFSILTATLVTRFGFSLSRPSASPITTWPKQPSPRGFPKTSLGEVEGRKRAMMITCYCNSKACVYGMGLSFRGGNR